MDPRREARRRIGEKRLQNILHRHIAASARTLEQKISDAGPTNQRIDPHILTESRNNLINTGIIQVLSRGDVPWYYLSTTDYETVAKRVTELASLHRRAQKPQFVKLMGQSLEIATFRALRTQTALQHFGHFSDLDDHDDDILYSKEEPPSSLSGRNTPGGKKLDFLIHHPQAGYAGIEVKNIREWMYPDRDEIRAMLFKCCSMDIVPVLIARRIHFSTFSVLNPSGVILHETFSQIYPNSARDLAEQVKDKMLLGYHDVRVGNIPDARLIRFVHDNLPMILPKARQSFDKFKDLLFAYSTGEHSYKSFAARVKRRMRGEPEDRAEFEVEPDDYEW